jgi:hypothetical protein
VETEALCLSACFKTKPSKTIFFVACFSYYNPSGGLNAAPRITADVEKFVFTVLPAVT